MALQDLWPTILLFPWLLNISVAPYMMLNFLSFSSSLLQVTLSPSHCCSFFPFSMINSQTPLLMGAAGARPQSWVHCLFPHTDSISRLNTLFPHAPLFLLFFDRDFSDPSCISFSHFHFILQVPTLLVVVGTNDAFQVLLSCAHQQTLQLWNQTGIFSLGDTWRTESFYDSC